MSMRLVSIAALALVASSPSRAEDLAKRYPATKEWSEQGLGTVSEAGDVWRVTSFVLGLGKDLKIAGKGANVVLGRNDTNVLWAVVFPDKPAEIESRLAGDGERTEAILVRFSPYDLGKLFPARTVKGPGEPWLRARASWIFRQKLGWKWSTPSGNTTIVPRQVAIVDADTDAGKRRFYFVDRQKGSVEVVLDFESQPLPAPEPIEEDAALAAFDEVAETFDREYAGFVLLPKLDWARAAKERRKAAGGCTNVIDLGGVIADLVAELEDLHAWVKVGDAWMPGYSRERPLNASWNGTRAELDEVAELGSNLAWGRTQDGIGYLGVHGLSDAELPARVDTALEALAETWALVVDLRFNGGGDEVLGRQVAGRFLDEQRVYAKNRYRAGPEHDDFGPLLERKLAPRGPWRYESPVVCLIGRRMMSSAESLVLMMAQCPSVTTMGAPTAGSSGNPRLLQLEHGIAVNVPRWLDLDTQENPIEHVGVAPQIAIEAASATFTDTSDPVLAAALARLRRQPGPERLPGKR